MATSLLLYVNINQWVNYMDVCAAWLIWPGQGINYAVMIGSSTYVGMITVGRAEQSSKAKLDMVTREVGRDRLVSFWLARRESYKRRREEMKRREEEKRSQQPGLL